MPERLPSVRSGSFEPADEVAIVVHSRGFAPHPIARLEPCLPRQRPVGRFELSRPARILASCPAPHFACEKDASLRLLQPTHDTSTQYAARFPISRPFLPCRLSTTWPSRLRRIADGVPTRAFALAGARRSSGGASLDGEPPASASPQPTHGTAGKPSIIARFEHGTIWSEPRSKAPSRLASRLRPCRPRAEHAAWPLTSSPTTAPLDPDFRLDLRWLSLGLASATLSSKTIAPSKPGRLPSTSALSSAPAHLLRSACAARRPLPAEALASVSLPRSPLARSPERGARDHEEPATVPTTSPSRAGFEHLFRSASPSRTSPEQPTELALMLPKQLASRCFPSTSAIRTAHEHNHRPSEPRSRPATLRIQLALDWEGTSGRGWGPDRFVDRPFQAGPRARLESGRPEGLPDERAASALPPSPESRDPNEGFRPIPAEVSRARGRPASRRSLSPTETPGGVYVHFAGVRTRERASPKLDPLEHLMSRSRSDIGWMVRHRRSSGLPRVTELTTIETIPSRKPQPVHRKRCTETDLRTPVRPACAGRPRRPARGSRRAWEPTWTTREAPTNRALHSAPRLHELHRRARRGRNGRPLTQPALPGPRARFPRSSAKSAEIGETRGAFHRMAPDVRDNGLTPAVALPAGAFHSLSPAVESTLRLFDPRLSDDLDGSSVGKDAVSSAAMGPKPTQHAVAMVAHPAPDRPRPVKAR